MAYDHRTDLHLRKRRREAAFKAGLRGNQSSEILIQTCQRVLTRSARFVLAQTPI